MKTLLITGGAGFIGSNLIRYLLEAGDAPERIVVLDLLTYAGHLENLRGVLTPERIYVPKESLRLHEVPFRVRRERLYSGEISLPFSAYNKIESFGFRWIDELDELDELLQEDGLHFVLGDINDGRLLAHLFPHVDSVIHLAAETHVDRSIMDPSAFIRTDVHGTFSLLEAARRHWKNFKKKRFLHVSTDEVYGEIKSGHASENYPLMPRNPYSSSKAAADMLARAYHTTYGLPVVVARPSNNYGPYQHPEKFIPLMITNAIEGRALPVYGNGRQRRDWLFVKDTARALYLLLKKGRPGEAYNISGSCEMENIEVIDKILGLLGKPRDLIKFVKDRPGHDRRYAMDSSRIREELGFVPEWDFDRGLRVTVEFYRNNSEWWEKIKREDEETRKFLESWYSSLEF